jgi:GNAT superfamily N-acetyltransferase
MDILGAPNARELFDAYAADCLMPGSKPQVEIYQSMEQACVLACFGAYAGDELVGFVTLVKSVMPHHGKRIASIESLFVEASHRAGGTGSRLLDAAREFAASSWCAALLYTARVGSELETLLSRREGCKRSHTVFTEWL